MLPSANTLVSFSRAQHQPTRFHSDESGTNYIVSSRTRTTNQRVTCKEITIEASFIVILRKLTDGVSYWNVLPAAIFLTRQYVILNMSSLASFNNST